MLTRRLLTAIAGVALSGVVLLVLLARQIADIPRPVTVAHAGQPAYTLIYIANERGYFSAEGLDVRLRAHHSDAAALDSVLSGETQLAAVHSAALLKHSRNRDQLRVLTRLHRAERNAALLARTDRGIVQPADLPGKRLGIAPDTTAAFFLHTYLREHDLNVSDVELVNLDPDEIPAALQAGRIDAAPLCNPQLFLAQGALGTTDSVTMYAKSFAEMSLLVGQQPVLINSRQALHALLRALSRAEAFVRAQPQQAVAQAAAYLSPGIASEVTAATMPIIMPGLGLGLDNLMGVMLQAQLDWRASVHGQLVTYDWVDALLFPAPLRAVRPDAVTVLD